MAPEASDQLLQQALALHQSGRRDEAEAVYRQILEADPGCPDALHFLGVLLHQRGRSNEAAELMRRAIASDPSRPNYYVNAVGPLLAIGCADEAIVACRRALTLLPASAQAFYGLGLALRNKAGHEEAAASFSNALKLEPNDPWAWNELGAELIEANQLDRAIGCFQRATELAPHFAGAHCNLGNFLRESGRLEEALTAHRRAHSLDPESAEYCANLADVLWRVGALDEALSWFRKAMQLKPHPRIGSNLLYVLHFDERMTPRELWEEHRRWNERFARPLASAIRPHENHPDPGRRLRVGYVSPNFCAHPVGRFLFPLFINRDRSQFEVFCYSDTRTVDGLTDLLKLHSDVWRNIRGMSDDQAAHLIRADQIDILVDLDLHVGLNRMLLFARKPAPVQVTYLAYPGTTGMDTVEYRLTDSYLDPPQNEDLFYSEKSIRLQTYWCYQPAKSTPELVPPPVLGSGGITFACLNNFCKVTGGALAVWCEVLSRVPGSRLLLHANPGRYLALTRQRVADRGIDPDRLEFISFLPMGDYFSLYNQIDIALDPFPYSGGTTTCDALWMGVPVVSLAGHMAISRGGLSILSNIGLSELVANSVEEYVEIAVRLANDWPRLRELRSTMRERMQSSPLMDAPAFARDVEAAFRQMWRKWCKAS